MTDLGPMPPTPDVGPVATDCGVLHSVAPNVWAWIGADAANDAGNAGVIIEPEGITIIDALAAPSAARALNNELAQRFGVPIRHVVYTSSHIDSVGGSAVFWMAARYGRSQTNALLDQPAPVEAYKRLAPRFEADFDTDPRTAEVRFTTRPVSHVVDAAAWLTPLVLAIPVSGEQEENLAVYMPSVGVMFAGALATIGATPNAWDGNPSAWADTLGELADLLVGDGDGGILVPGRGPLGTADDLLLQQAYLYACDEAAQHGSPLSAGPWDDWSDRDLDAVNIERSALLANGDHSVPPAMMKRLGMGTD
ncbi:MAG: MBL fold metallo-hydrolase [Acidimicrobiales bacterium]